MWQIGELMHDDLGCGGLHRVCQRCRIEYIDHHRLGAERAQGGDLIRRARGSTHHVMACPTQERRQATSNRTARSGQKYSHSVFPRSFKEWRRRSFLIWINDWPERCLPTVGLGNRFGCQHFNDLCPNVANVLHPFPRHEIPQHIFARADDLPARCPLLFDTVEK
jgi:hypothetical protein